MKKSSICLCSKVESLARDDVHQSPGKWTSPGSRHSACCLPKQLVLYYHDVELLQLEQERKPPRMSVKTYFLLFRTLAIDRLSHVSQEREPAISQFLQNVAVRPKLWHTTVQPHLDWVRFRPSETSFNMAAAAETKWRWDLHTVESVFFVQNFVWKNYPLLLVESTSNFTWTFFLRNFSSRVIYFCQFFFASKIFVKLLFIWAGLDVFPFKLMKKEACHRLQHVKISRNWSLGFVGYTWHGDRVERGESCKPTEHASGEMIFPRPPFPPKVPQMG